MPMKENTGYFLFSLDTELGWGFFDYDHLRAKRFSPDGSRERRAIELLLNVLDEFGIVATWAIVGHLLYDRCEECNTCPVLEWKGKYRSFAEVYKTDNRLWYGADVIETLLSRGARHEIAFHGYTHEPFDETTMSKEAAKTEINEWLRVSERQRIVPLTVIFPRDRVGHLNVFKEAGFICYRSDEILPLPFRPRYIGPLIKSIDHILSLSTPAVYELNGAEPCGLVNLRSSQHFFGFNRKLETILDSLNLHNLRLARMVRGVRKAADEKKIFHLWAHPCEFRTEKDFAKLRYLFGYVADEMSKGKLQSIGMADLARHILFSGQSSGRQKDK